MINKEHLNLHTLNRIFIPKLLITFLLIASCGDHKEILKDRFETVIHFKEKSYLSFQNNSNETIYIPKKIILEKGYNKNKIDTVILGTMFRDSMITPNYFNPNKLVQLKPLSKLDCPIQIDNFPRFRNSPIFIRIF